MTQAGRTAVPGRLGGPRQGRDESPDCRIGIAPAPCHSQLPDLLTRELLSDMDPARHSCEARFLGRSAK